MRSFLTKILVFGLLVTFVFFIILTFVDFLGLSDYAYKRVTSDYKGSLIIGTSRAAQALQPAVMNPILTQNKIAPLYNFAFTINDSPYGEVYYDAIKKKIGSGDSSNRMFIICVDPFSLCSIREIDGDGMRDKKGVLRALPFYLKPNYLYLVRNYKPRDWIEMSKYELLHDDGWLEVSVEMDSTAISRNKDNRIALYQSYTAEPSHNRIEWLENTIRLLKNNGDVYLCRLSTCLEMNEIEDAIWPDFEQTMTEMALSFNSRYFSFYNDFEKYRTIDGNHIYKEDGKLISRALCDSIFCGIGRSPLQ